MTIVGDLSYDPSTNRLYKYGRPISIGPAPLRLLAFLMDNAERSFTMDELIGRVWGGDVLADEKARSTIRQQVRRIRTAIEDDRGPWLIHEMGAGGYGLWVEPPVMRAQQLAVV